MTRSKKEATRSDDVELSTESGPAATGDRQQETEDGAAGIPVEEMPQSQREQVGRLMADGSSFAEAYEQTAASSTDAKEETDFDSMTKDELRAYADENGIEGVTSSMTKDEMVQAVKDGSKP